MNLKIWKEPPGRILDNEDDEDRNPETPSKVWKDSHLIATTRSTQVSHLNGLNGPTGISIDIATGSGITTADLRECGQCSLEAS